MSRHDSKVGIMSVKKNLTVRATDGETTVEITAKITADLLTRSEVNAVAEDLGDRLMTALPGTKYTRFRISKMTVG